MPEPPVGAEAALVVVGEPAGAVELGALGEEPILLRMLSHSLLGKLPGMLVQRYNPPRDRAYLMWFFAGTGQRVLGFMAWISLPESGQGYRRRQLSCLQESPSQPCRWRAAGCKSVSSMCLISAGCVRYLHPRTSNQRDRWSGRIEP